MSGLPWFKVYAAETLSDERFQGWAVDERGAWFTLLLTAWREGSIPGDMASLARLLHVDASAMRSLWSAIGDRFIPHPDVPGRLTSPRLEMEREEAEKLREKKSEAGKRGATSRWETEKRRHSKRMRVPRANGATPMANDSAQLSTAQSRTDPPPTRARARLVSPFGEADPHPLTSAVLAGLFALGLDAAPPAAASADRVEAAVKAVGVETATERVAERLRAGAEKPLTFHVEAIRGQKPKRRTHGDLGAELSPWQARLTPEERDAWRQEAVAICGPDCADAPVGVVGAHGELTELNDRYRAIAEARAQ